MEKPHHQLTEEELERAEQEKRCNSVTAFAFKESSLSDAEVRVAEEVEKMQEVLNVISHNLSYTSRYTVRS